MARARSARSNPSEQLSLFDLALPPEDADEVLGPPKAGETPEEYRLRSYQALATAEELTLADHPLLQPDPSEETEDWSDEPDLARHYQDLAEINEVINTPL